MERGSLAWITAVCAILMACSHAGTLEPSYGQLQSVLDSAGHAALDRETARDPTLRAWVERHGMPQYILVESARRVLLFDAARDVAAQFERPPLGRVSSEPTERPIRAVHHALFSDSDRSRLGVL